MNNSTTGWTLTLDSEIQVLFAKKERELADSYDSKINELYSQYSSMGDNGYWVGEDYIAFINGVNEYKKALLDVGHSIRAYANYFENDLATGTDELSEEVFQIIDNITER